MNPYSKPYTSYACVHKPPKLYHYEYYLRVGTQPGSGATYANVDYPEGCVSYDVLTVGAGGKGGTASPGYASTAGGGGGETVVSFNHPRIHDQLGVGFLPTPLFNGPDVIFWANTEDVSNPGTNAQQTANNGTDGVDDQPGVGGSGGITFGGISGAGGNGGGGLLDNGASQGGGGGGAGGFGGPGGTGASLNVPATAGQNGGGDGGELGFGGNGVVGFPSDLPGQGKTEAGLGYGSPSGGGFVGGGGHGCGINCSNNPEDLFGGRAFVLVRFLVLSTIKLK